MSRSDLARLRIRAVATVAALVVLVAGARPAEAQSIRLQGGWVAGHVGGVALGVEGRTPIGPEPPLPLPGRPGSGPVEAPTRPWLLTAMVAPGLNAATPDGDPDVDWLVYGHGGVLYRTGSSLITNVGLVGAFYLPVKAVGPAALLEAADLIDVQAGVLHTPRGWMGHSALTVSLRFLKDILGG